MNWFRQSKCITSDGYVDNIQYDLNFDLYIYTQVIQGLQLENKSFLFRFDGN